MRTLALCIALLVIAPASADTSQQEWLFRVFVDRKEVGTHRFTLRESGDQRLLESRADFVYKFLFLNLYRYQHQNTETWQGDCLTGIDATTDDNGKTYEVEGHRSDGHFLIRNGESESELPACVMTFAYWNPAFLEQDRLLNSQTGELVDVEVSDPELVEVEVNGAKKTARRYLLEAGEMDIRLWYSDSSEWLALETEAAGGKTLRYELF